jgi:hypothetical protein
MRGGFDHRLALGVYISGGSYSTDPAKWERDFFSDAGWGLQGVPINVVLPYWLGNMPLEATRSLLDVLSHHGISFLLTGNSFNFGSWKRQPFAMSSQGYVRAFSQHPAALGYYIADEPAEPLIPETEEHYHQLKDWDPEGAAVTICMAGFVPNEKTRTDPRKWADSCDVLGVDPYPLYGREPAAGYAHFSVADYVSKCVAASRPGQPTWAVLQLFKFTSDSRLPTPDEMRAHAVMSIVEGARGILWWDIGVNGLRKNTPPDTVASYMGHLRELVTELAGLEEVLLQPNMNDMLVNSTRFADPVAGRIEQLKHNAAVDPLWSRVEWYRAQIAALWAGDRSDPMLTHAAKVRTRASYVPGKIGCVAAYNYSNVPEDVTFEVRDIPGYGTLRWRDTIEGYGARIYLIRPGGPSGLDVRESKSGQVYPQVGTP